MHRVVLYCSTTAFETCGLRRRGGERELRLLHEEVARASCLDHVVCDSQSSRRRRCPCRARARSDVACAAVAIASQRRTNRRPLTIGPTARPRSAPGSFECPLSQMLPVHSRPSQQRSLHGWHAVSHFLALKNACSINRRKNGRPFEPRSEPPGVLSASIPGAQSRCEQGFRAKGKTTQN